MIHKLYSFGTLSTHTIIRTIPTKSIMIDSILSVLLLHIVVNPVRAPLPPHKPINIEEEYFHETISHAANWQNMEMAVWLNARKRIRWSDNFSASEMLTDDVPIGIYAIYILKGDDMERTEFDGKSKWIFHKRRDPLALKFEWNDWGFYKTPFIILGVTGYYVDGKFQANHKKQFIRSEPKVFAPMAIKVCIMGGVAALVLACCCCCCFFAMFGWFACPGQRNNALRNIRG